MKAIHVEHNRKMSKGIDALIILWKEDGNILASFASFPLLYPFFKLGYYIFSRVRHR
jgi:hypothetical protein